MPAPVNLARRLSRRRIALAVVAAATIPFGLLAMKYGWWGGSAGAVAYEVLFIAAAQFVFIRARTSIIALMVLLATCGVELLQLYNAPWIVAVRATLPGRLLLGTNGGFDALDFARYLVGCAVGLALCFAFRERVPRDASHGAASRGDASHGDHDNTVP